MADCAKKSVSQIVGVIGLVDLSGILGGLYTWQYNQMGRRAPLGEDPDASRKLPTRIKL